MDGEHESRKVGIGQHKSGKERTRWAKQERTRWALHVKKGQVCVIQVDRGQDKATQIKKRQDWECK